MIIPLEGENVLCLANVIAIYRTPEGAKILRRDGKTESSVFSPLTLKKRMEALAAQSAVKGRSF